MTTTAQQTICLDNNGYTDAYSQVCDVVERNWHDRPDRPDMKLPDDGLFHTSKEARAALRIFEILGIEMTR